MNANASIRLSVLVPIYGVEKYIADCTRSLFTQSLWEGVEFIFVDDASPDASIEVLGKILAEYPARVAQVRILRHDVNRGLAAARRTAIDAARGEWLLHVDSDDILTPDAAMRLLAASDTHPDTDLVFGDFYAAADPVQACGRTRYRTPKWSRERLLHSLIAQNHRVTNRTWGILIRRTLCTLNGIYPVEGINFAEDYAVMPRLLHAAHHTAILSDPIYGYRLASDGSYMKRLDARAAAQYVAANRVVTDYLKPQPDYDTLRESVILGRLNIEKWIVKRGLNPQEYDARLFYDGDRPKRWLHRLYAAAIESGVPLLARIAGIIANGWS